MATEQQVTPHMRVYPLDPQKLTQEQIAVTFAMTSRSPEPFDEISRVVSEAKAADFNEKWVVGYGHASVAEHAVLHLAVENVSRLACDELEDNRLASYTEKSSRYQILDRGSYHTPHELRGHALESLYVETCDHLFDVYHRLLEQTQDYLRGRDPQREGERDGAFRLRIRRIATDHCRFVLPASTLTNVGVTINARGLEHAITKLLSSELAESREIGERLKEEGRAIAPTLVKYADASDYLTEARRTERASAWYRGPETGESKGPGEVEVRLVSYDQAAEEKLAAALLYRVLGDSYDDVLQRAAAMEPSEREQVIETALSGLGPFDAPLRETELTDYIFEMEMDYGAYREYRRHRMQTTIPQRLEVSRGYVAPFVVEEAGAMDLFREAMATADLAYRRLAEEFPSVAEYVVTHAHKRRLLAKMNLRECYHLLKLRSAAQAHFTIREIALKCLHELRRVHPLLIKFIHLRD
jgi:thymidylate synthase ThyX